MLYRFCHPCHRCALNLSPRWNKIPSRPLLLAPLAQFLALASSVEVSLWHPSWSNVNNPKENGCQSMPGRFSKMQLRVSETCWSCQLNCNFPLFTGYIISCKCLQPLLGNLHYFRRHAIQQHACAFLGVLRHVQHGWPGGVSKSKSFKLGRRIRMFLIANTDPLMPQRNTGAETCAARVLMHTNAMFATPEASWGSFHNQ